jgi:hypothetical protein
MTHRLQCAICSMTVFATTCPKCGALYQNGVWVAATKQPQAKKPRITPQAAR